MTPERRLAVKIGGKVYDVEVDAGTVRVRGGVLVGTVDLDHVADVVMGCEAVADELRGGGTDGADERPRGAGGVR